MKLFTNIENINVINDININDIDEREMTLLFDVDENRG